MARYHISKNGTPAICRAKDGNCPLGPHYDTEEEAQVGANEINELEFGMTKEMNEIGQPTEEEIFDSMKDSLSDYYEKIDAEKKAQKKKEEDEKNIHRIHGIKVDFREIDFPKGDTLGRKPKNRKEMLYNESRMLDYAEMKKKSEKTLGPKPYWYRMKESIKHSGDFDKSNRSHHLDVERSGRQKEIERILGKGKVIGHYLLHHDLSDGDGHYEWQIMEIRDTGQITVYKEDSKEAVTTIIPTRSRMESIIIKAGDLPNRDFLDKVTENRTKWNKENKVYQVQRELDRARRNKNAS